MIGGIAGELRFDRTPSELLITRMMCDAQVHRGPDYEGYHVQGSVSLGIRWRAADDLGKQLWPLCNENGSIHLVFDGWIYGSHALRLQLERLGHKFRSRTDLEVIVHGYEEWRTKYLERLDGMFGFALWDEPRRLLWLARDRFGIKPLHYYLCKDFIAFASEMKSLLRHPDISAIPNERVIRRYLEKGLVGIGEETFFAGISRLPPASHLLVPCDGELEKQRYWKPTISRELNSMISRKTIARTRDLFLDAVRQQLVNDSLADASLSGGIDSSSIVCATKRICPMETRVRTFSASFPDDPIDETGYARVVCDAIEAENHVFKLTADDFWRDFPTLIRCQEEPMRLSFAYAQWRLMKCASDHGVRVILEGHGGDELLCGYSRYYVYYLMTLIKQRKYRRAVAEALLSRDLTKTVVRDLIRTHWPTLRASLRLMITAILNEKNRGRTPNKKNELLQALTTDLAARLLFDLSHESLPVGLRYADMNSAWHGIEVRLPFLEKTFAEHCASLPLDQKMRDGWTKYALRLAMKDILPEQIRLRRDKIGFQMPIERWISGELRQKLRDFFFDASLRGARYYNRETARKILSKRELSLRDAALIWRMLNVELWCREFF